MTKTLIIKFSPKVGNGKKNKIELKMDMLLWLTDRPAYNMLKKLRWEMEIMDLANKIIKK